MNQLTPNPILRNQDVANHLNICPRKAYQLLHDIKEEYKIEYVTLIHLNKYLKVS